jgi:transmembrane sensor
VRVAVTRGKVRVRSAGGTMLVSAGESVWFAEQDPRAPREDSHNSASDNAQHAATSAPTPSAALAQPVPASKLRANNRAARHASAREEAPPWRSLSQSGDYEAAYQLLAEGTVVEDDSETLLDAADAARLSGHPEAASRYLRSVLVRHRTSPVAPLAAFTLGRVLLERLGQPSEAAAAFATARELSPEGSLAQDALAREVEAWSKAGHPQEAYERARLYVSSYPEGRRLKAVQLYGGLR